MAQPRVLLADDHPLFREALHSVLVRLRPDFLIQHTDSLAGARKVLQRDLHIALVLLDLKLPDCDGLMGLLTLRAEFPHTPIIIVSAPEDAAMASNAIATGASGFIPTSASMTTMSDALQTILAGDIWTPEHLVLTGPSDAVRALASLTPSQARTLSWLRRGFSNKRIAGELGMPEAEVTADLAVAFRKLGVVNRSQALGLVAAEYQAPSSAPA